MRCQEMTVERHSNAGCQEQIRGRFFNQSLQNVKIWQKISLQHCHYLETRICTSPFVASFSTCDAISIVFFRQDNGLASFDDDQSLWSCSCPATSIVTARWHLLTKLSQNLSWTSENQTNMAGFLCASFPKKIHIIALTSLYCEVIGCRRIKVNWSCAVNSSACRFVSEFSESRPAEPVEWPCFCCQNYRRVTQLSQHSVSHSVSLTHCVSQCVWQQFLAECRLQTYNADSILPNG